MMKKLGITALSVLCLAAAGCSFLAPRVDPSRFFVLTPIPTPPAATAQAKESAKQDFTLGLGPIQIPSYLQHSQVAIRVEPNRIEFSDVNRWAEPLSDGFERVLAQNLKLLLGADAVILYPWSQKNTPDLAVSINVQRFEPDQNGNAVLGVSWAVRNHDGKQILGPRNSLFTASAEGDAFEGTVAAMNSTLGELSREIAETVRELRNQKPSS